MHVLWSNCLCLIGIMQVELKKRIKWSTFILITFLLVYIRNIIIFICIPVPKVFAANFQFVYV